MTPLQHFYAVWHRADHLSAVHAFLARQAAPALRADEILRAEWAARVSALDLYVHELVAQRMLEVFEGRRTASPGYNKFRLTNETVHRIASASMPTAASAAFDLDVREQLARITYQDPENIADGVRCFSAVELWNEVAVRQGATEATKVRDAKRIKRELSAIVQRRNKIVHEGDLQPALPRVPWPVSQADLRAVSSVIEGIVQSIDAIAV